MFLIPETRQMLKYEQKLRERRYVVRPGAMEEMLLLLGTILTEKGGRVKSQSSFLPSPSGLPHCFSLVNLH